MTLVYAMIGACGPGVTGGIASASRNNLRALADLARERGCPLEVLSLAEEPADRPLFLAPDTTFRAFRGDKVRFAGALLSRAATRPLVLFDHVSLAAPLLPLAASGWSRPVIFCHGSESWKRLETVNRWSYQQAALCLTNSHYTLRRMEQTFSGFRGRACPLGLAPEFQLEQRLPEPQAPLPDLEAADGTLRPLGPRVLLLVGRMHPGEREKGHPQLIGALPALRSSFPEAQLVFAGPGDDIPNLARLAREAGVGERVFLPGRISQDGLEALYRGAFAFVMPSRQEGFGLAYLEAMSFGKPCVGCFEDGGEDVIVHGETGLLVRDPDDADELLSVLATLLEDPGRARDFGEKGFRRVHDHFTAAQAQARVREAVAELL